MFSFPPRHLYACPNVWLTQRLVELDVAPPTFMRAPGETMGTFALEFAIDELAHELNMDPIELHARNEPDQDPATGLPFSNRNIKEAYMLGAEKFGWSRRNPTPRSMRDGRCLVGMGVATAFYPYYRFPAAARVRLNADGTAHVQCGAQEMGMGTATVHTLLVAELLGLPPAKVHTQHGDTNLPFAAVAGGSTTTVSAGSAISSACASLREKLLDLARDGDGPLAKVARDEIEFRDEGMFSKADRCRGERYQSLLARHRKVSIDARADTKPSSESEKYAMYSYGAQFCEVRVDPDLCEVRVSRFVDVFDVGRIISAKTARSQFIGGITMGIGMALMEETRVDERILI